MSIKTLLDQWKQLDESDLDVESLAPTDNPRGRSDVVWKEFGSKIVGGQVLLSAVVEELGVWLANPDSQARVVGTAFLSLLLAQLSNPAFSASNFRVGQVARPYPPPPPLSCPLAARHLTRHLSRVR